MSRPFEAGDRNDRQFGGHGQLRNAGADRLGCSWRLPPVGCGCGLIVIVMRPMHLAAGLAVVVVVSVVAGCAGNSPNAGPSQTQAGAVTPAPVSCATGGGSAGTCVVGDTGSGGGKVFYVNENNPTGSRYMEAVVAGMTPAWSDTNGGPGYKWCGGAAGERNKVTTSDAIGAGKVNTDNMVAACKSGAANRVRAYTGGLGAGSWSLPSKDELNALYAQRATVGGFAAANVRDSTTYWSSSQIAPGTVWSQGFIVGNQNSDSVVFSSNRVRPVRAF